MTATRLLTQLFRRGATLRLTGDRVGIRDPEGPLTPELREAVAAHKSELVLLLRLADEYRSLLRRAFGRGGVEPQGAEETKRFQAERTHFLDQRARLTDELGPTLAATICRTVSREWREATGACPGCGEPGESCRCADPEPGAGSA